jgi:RNA polymerase sigma-70 factor (ECF subfamily)
LAAGSGFANAAAREQEGGCDILERAVHEHARLVYRIAYSVLRNHHDAEDATQETFLRVLKYGRKLAGVRDQKTWLARIAWHVAIDRKKKMPEMALDDIPAASLATGLVDAHEIVRSSEMSALLARLIGALPGELQRAITLSTLEEMSTSDVAQVLRIEEATVRSRLFRARQILKIKLAGIFEKPHGSGR